MRKHNQFHTLDALHYKTHFWFLRKLKDFKRTLRSKKYSILGDMYKSEPCIAMNISVWIESKILTYAMHHKPYKFVIYILVLTAVLYQLAAKDK